MPDNIRVDEEGIPIYEEFGLLCCDCKEADFGAVKYGIEVPHCHAKEGLNLTPYVKRGRHSKCPFNPKKGEVR